MSHSEACTIVAPNKQWRRNNPGQQQSLQLFSQEALEWPPRRRQNEVAMNDGAQRKLASIKEHLRGLLSCICQEQGLGEETGERTPELVYFRAPGFPLLWQASNFLISTKYLSLSEPQTPGP